MKNKTLLCVNKKIIYFLMAGKSGQARKLLKYSILIQKNKKIPACFIKKSRSFFEKNRKNITNRENDFFSPWRCFCKTAHYEEVLLVVLYGILRYSKEKLSWILGVSPETVSYRVNQGLSLLGETLFNQSSKERSSQNQSDEKAQIKKKALIYCQELDGLPLSFNKGKNNRKFIRIRYLLWAVICLGAFFFVVWLFSLMFSAPKTIILYPSFLDKVQYNNSSFC